MKKIVPICAAVAAAAMMLSISTPAMAMGGPSGPHVTYPVQGNIGEVIVNPYKVAPLTAVIRDAGYDLSDVTSASCRRRTVRRLLIKFPAQN